MDADSHVEQKLLDEYKEAHLQYLQAAPRARATLFGKPVLLEREDDAALNAARERLLVARESLHQFWDSQPNPQEVAR